jgi:hypothetical protein
VRELVTLLKELLLQAHEIATTALSQCTSVKLDYTVVQLVIEVTERDGNKQVSIHAT